MGVGDSVRFSLARLTELRLGETEIVVVAKHGLFRAALAADVGRELGVSTSPVLLLDGMVGSRGATVAGVRIVGVEPSFWALGKAPDPVSGETPDRVAVNRPLATALGLTTGDDLVVRVERPDAIPGELPFRSADRVTVPIVGTVASVVADDAMGRFDLQPHQTPRPTVFLPLDALATALGQAGRANCLLAGGRDGRGLEVEEVRLAVARTWRLADAGLMMRPLQRRKGFELVSDRVMLPEVVEAAARAVDPEAQPILTWLTTSLTANELESPYAFVSAPGPPLVPSTIADDEMIVTDWLAEDLDLVVGDEVRLQAFVPTAAGGLREESCVFRVRRVVAMTGPANDPGLMPPIPGLQNAEDCRRWDPGLPIDLERIRPQDELYWDEHGGAPKAFIGLEAARRLWAGRFGSLTAVRFSPDRSAPDALSTALRDTLHHEELGLEVVAVRTEGLAAGAEAVDFGQLFVGLSWFLIVAALLITGLLFVLAVEERRAEHGVLAAVGFESAEITRLVVAEGVLVAGAGIAIGTVCGWCYTRSVIGLLNSVWRGAVQTSSLMAHIEASTLLIGGATGALCAGGAILAGALIRRRVCVVENLQASAGCPLHPVRRGRVHFTATVAVLGVAIAAWLVMFGGGGANATTLFWLAGGLMLVALSAAWRVALAVLSGTPAGSSVTSLGLRRLADGPRRATMSAVVLAIGVFIVVAVAANRQAGPENPEDRKSGTGGFSWWIETSIPFRLDLESNAGQRRLGFEALPGSQVVGLSRRRGDDASCLNLHHIRRPSLLGIPITAMVARDAFTFVDQLRDSPSGSSWQMLEGSLPDGSIPAVADHEVIRWALGLGLGDSLVVRDERGRERRLTLVGGLAPSVFQGHVLISADNLSELYPSLAGFEVLLVDPAVSGRTPSAGDIAGGLRDWGPVVESTVERLAIFRGVQDTYLSIFLALGGLGLLLGTAGVGVLALRDVLEQRSQLAVLRALGLDRAAVARVVLTTWGSVVAAGVTIGVTAALIAVLPAVRAPGGVIPWGSVLLLLVAIVVSGWLWIRLAARWAVSGDLLSALRHE